MKITDLPGLLQHPPGQLQRRILRRRGIGVAQAAAGQEAQKWRALAAEAGNGGGNGEFLGVPHLIDGIFRCLKFLK